MCAQLVEWALQAVAGAAEALGQPAPPLQTAPAVAVSQAAAEMASSGGEGTPLLNSLLRQGAPLPGRPEVRPGMVLGGVGREGVVTALTEGCVLGKAAWKPVKAFSFRV